MKSSQAPTEQKARCKFCRVSFLRATARRTGGYCMRHQRMGFPFLQRLETRLLPGAVSDLETARREFHDLLPECVRESLDGRDPGLDAQFGYDERLPGKFWEVHADVLHHHWARFERKIRPGDVIRRFSSYPSELCELYATAGFFGVRGTRLIEGVITKFAADPVTALEHRALMMDFMSGQGTLEMLEASDLDILDSYWVEFMY